MNILSTFLASLFPKMYSVKTKVAIQPPEPEQSKYFRQKLPTIDEILLTEKQFNKLDDTSLSENTLENLLKKTLNLSYINLLKENNQSEIKKFKTTTHNILTIARFLFLEDYLKDSIPNPIPEDLFKELNITEQLLTEGIDYIQDKLKGYSTGDAGKKQNTDTLIDIAYTQIQNKIQIIKNRNDTNNIKIAFDFGSEAIEEYKEACNFGSKAIEEAEAQNTTENTTNINILFKKYKTLVKVYSAIEAIDHNITEYKRALDEILPTKKLEETSKDLENLTEVGKILFKIKYINDNENKIKIPRESEEGWIILKDIDKQREKLIKLIENQIIIPNEKVQEEMTAELTEAINNNDGVTSTQNTTQNKKNNKHEAAKVSVELDTDSKENPTSNVAQNTRNEITVTAQVHRSHDDREMVANQTNQPLQKEIETTSKLSQNTPSWIEEQCTESIGDNNDDCDREKIEIKSGDLEAREPIEIIVETIEKFKLSKEDKNFILNKLFDTDSKNVNKLVKELYKKKSRGKKIKDGIAKTFIYRNSFFSLNKKQQALFTTIHFLIPLILVIGIAVGVDNFLSKLETIATSAVLDFKNTIIAFFTTLLLSVILFITGKIIKHNSVERKFIKHFDDLTIIDSKLINKYLKKKEIDVEGKALYWITDKLMKNNLCSNNEDKHKSSYLNSNNAKITINLHTNKTKNDTNKLFNEQFNNLPTIHNVKIDNMSDDKLFEIKNKSQAKTIIKKDIGQQLIENYAKIKNKLEKSQRKCTIAINALKDHKATTVEDHKSITVKELREFTIQLKNLSDELNEIEWIYNELALLELIRKYSNETNTALETITLAKTVITLYQETKKAFVDELKPDTNDFALAHIKENQKHEYRIFKLKKPNWKELLNILESKTELKQTSVNSATKKNKVIEV